MRYISFIFIFIISCSSEEDIDISDIINDDVVNEFYSGADLSYVNEMEDCGALYYDSNNNNKDPYKIFSDSGANLIRIRLWHNPSWTDYSKYNDVKKSISRAKTQGMKVLLNFHYSDTWADPSKQQIPVEWLEYVNNTEVLGDLLHDYTFNVLNDLSIANLLPDIVQVGNEINPMILQDGELQWPIDWDRNSSLLNKAIKAVREISSLNNKNIEVMLHVAQPENALWWFEQANEASVTDFDWIGLSYYPLWSDYSLNNISTPLKSLINNYKKRLMIVETAYPFTLTNNDTANNILGENAVIPGFPATQEGQLNYLNTLKSKVKDAGGEGLIYWEPAWVSTNCNTLWGQGSHWDNSTLFDQNIKSTLGMNFYNSKLINPY